MKNNIMKAFRKFITILIFLAFFAILSIDTTFAGATGVLLQFAGMTGLILLTLYLAKHTRTFDDLIEKSREESNEA